MRAVPAFPVLAVLAMGISAVAAHAQQGFPGGAGSYAISSRGSQIAFAVPQVGGGGIAGRFSSFEGEMTIDPSNVASSRVTISIFPASVTTGKTRVDNFLRSNAVFDTAHEREIRFVSTRVLRTGERTALIEGNLTARGRTVPESFTAELMNSSGRAISFHVVGDVYRSPFGMDVGRPIYSNKVNFDMTLSGVRR
ncbi:YceI family protein [Aquamicrobium sp. LC103]|uniref:YceI family protein n=1 Tax=Aquamicrobium sp. LC103 TaxID=1120658 RepID=UPI000699F3A2|nr:YceI family protein [Aquamicrobium sp. LC103]